MIYKKYIPPTIDYSTFQKWDELSLEEKQEFSKGPFKRAMLNAGEASIINCPSYQVEKDTKQVLSSFFALPEELKQHLSSQKQERGYIATGTRNDSHKSMVQYGLQKNFNDSADAEGAIWPNQLTPSIQKSYRDNGCDPQELHLCIDNLIKSREDLSQNVMRALALMLDKNENYFISHTQKANSCMRFLDYHPPTDDNKWWARMHTDKSLLTSLLPAPGLVIERPGEDGKYEIQGREEGYLIQFGLHVEVLTNGLIKSTRHGVLASNDRDEQVNIEGMNGHRYQAPYFINLDDNFKIAPFESAVTERNGVNYYPISMNASEIISLGVNEYRALQIAEYVRLNGVSSDCLRDILLEQRVLLSDLQTSLSDESVNSRVDKRTLENLEELILSLNKTRMSTRHDSEISQGIEEHGFD